MRVGLELSAAEVSELPVDELALAVLDDMIERKTWNEANYLLEVGSDERYRDGRCTYAVAEALGWLRSTGLIARDPSQSSEGAIFVTRAGRKAASEGVDLVRASVRLNAGLHPLIERRARRQFLLGEFEQAVFVSLKAVEVRVRRLGAFPDELVGVALMNQAFGTSGRLTDPAAAKGEQDGTRSLFAGAYAVLRNPAGHRDVDYDDVGEAAEAVTAASLLMRILDRVERRLQQP